VRSSSSRAPTCREGQRQQHAAQGVRAPGQPWYTAVSHDRASTSSSNPYDIAPSLRIGGPLLTPHSVGSMGGSAGSDLWGSPSMGSSAFGGTRSGALHADPAAPAASGGRTSGLSRQQRQPSIDVRNLPGMSQGSLYNAFYSGLDVSATPPQSMPRSGVSSVATRGQHMGTPTPQHSRSSLTLTMGPRRPDSGSEQYLCALPLGKDCSFAVCSLERLAAAHAFQLTVALLCPRRKRTCSGTSQLEKDRNLTYANASPAGRVAQARRTTESPAQSVRAFNPTATHASTSGGQQPPAGASQARSMLSAQLQAATSSVGSNVHALLQQPAPPRRKPARSISQSASEPVLPRQPRKSGDSAKSGRQRARAQERQPGHDATDQPPGELTESASEQLSEFDIFAINGGLRDVKEGKSGPGEEESPSVA
jgi:hypothetical protein